VPLPNPLPDTPEPPISYLGSLANRLSATRVLNQEEQSVLILDLKGRLRDPETAEDARSLLKQFRERRELLAAIAFEIDEVLARSEGMINLTIGHAGALPIWHGRRGLLATAAVFFNQTGVTAFVMGVQELKRARIVEFQRKKMLKFRGR
jgi:hypothetical protein